jgi:hypothetical protein
MAVRLSAFAPAALYSQEDSCFQGRQACKADNLNAICDPIVQKLCEPPRLRTLWASTASYKDSFTLPSISMFYTKILSQKKTV